MVKDFNLTEENIYSEYYGVKYKELKEFSDLCHANNMIFCDCIFGGKEDWEHFKRYLKKRYNLSSHLMNHDIGFGLIELNGPTTNKNKYNENLEKIKNIGGRLYKIQLKIQKSYNRRTKMIDRFINFSKLNK